MAVPPAHPSPPPQPKSSGGGPKSSTVVKLGAVGVLSILVVGFCAAQRTQKVNADCVDTSRPLPDGSYAVVDDDHCDDSSYRYHGSHGAYRWYYGGSRNGGRVRGGTTAKPADAQITTRSGRVIQRGGFGFHVGGRGG